jgi:hypothetical protein
MTGGKKRLRSSLIFRDSHVRATPAKPTIFNEPNVSLQYRYRIPIKSDRVIVTLCL